MTKMVYVPTSRSRGSSRAYHTKEDCPKFPSSYQEWPKEEAEDRDFSHCYFCSL